MSNLYLCVKDINKKLIYDFKKPKIRQILCSLEEEEEEKFLKQKYLMGILDYKLNGNPYSWEGIPHKSDEDAKRYLVLVHFYPQEETRQKRLLKVNFIF